MRRSSLRRLCRQRLDLAVGGDSGRGLRGQFQAELGEQEFLSFVWGGVAAEDHDAFIGSREVDVEHLHGTELLEDRARREPGSFEPQLVTQSRVETKGQEGDEDMGFDAILLTVEDRPQGEIAFEVFEGFLYLCKQNVELPDLGRVICAEVGAQQVAAFATTELAQFVFAQTEGEEPHLLRPGLSPVAKRPGIGFWRRQV